MTITATTAAFAAAAASTNASSSAFPNYISGIHHSGWDFCLCNHSLVTLCPHGWYMLDVFLLLAFTRLEHEVRIFWVCAQTRPQFILSSERVLGEWSHNPSLLQGKNPLYRKNSPYRKIEPTTLHQAGQWPQHTHNWAIPAPTNTNPMIFFFFFFFFLRSPAISLGFTTFGWDFCVCDRFLIQPLR